MIFIFGFLLLLFLLILIFLSYQGKINYNVPIIFLFFIMTMSPFLYLAKTKNKIENYSNWNQTMNSSLDIYYTNTNKNKKATNGCNECPGVCDAESQEYGNTLKPVASDINNPVQLKSSTKNLSEIQLTLNSSLNQFSAYISVPKKNKSFSFFANNNALQFIQLQANELLKFADNPSSNILTSNASSIQINSPNSTTMLINSLNRVPNNSYIILATVGYNLSGILDAPQNNLADLSQIYQLTNLNQIINDSLYRRPLQIHRLLHTNQRIPHLPTIPLPLHTNLQSRQPRHQPRIRTNRHHLRRNPRI